MAIRDDEQDGIVFLHRVTPGCIGRSYGVYVAKLAGMPPSIVHRAEEVLKHLEAGGIPYGAVHLSSQNGHAFSEDGLMVAESNGRYEWQSEEAHRAAQALDNAQGMERDFDTVDVFAITPLDALNLLFMMQKKRSKLKR
jgi:DNA mismatch repair protein MutS